MMRLRQIFRNRWSYVGLACGMIWLGWQLAVISMPLPATLESPPSISASVQDRHGNALRLIITKDNSFHQPVAWEECGENFINATLAAEDKRFWKHAGVDWISVGRAAKDAAAQGRVVSGASTITQQLIKNAQLRPRTLRTKLLEALQASKLERHWSKRQIFTAYINRIDYGNLCRGAGAASQYYFGKPLAELSPAEAAFLAGLPNGPSRFNPHRHFERASSRQHTILHRMHRNGVLDHAAYQRARAETVVIEPQGRAFAASHFVDWLKAKRELKSEAVTTLDLPLNRYAHETLVDRLQRLRKRNVTNGAVVVIENATGNVLAMVGSRDYFEAGHGQVNGACSPRSAGSTLKPFTYLLGMECGLSPATLLADVPTEYATATGVFAPQNFGRKFSGPVRLRLALANSLNVPAVRVLQQVGGVARLQSRLKECGFTTLGKPAVEYGLGLTIGNADVTLLELTNAYAALARLGIYRPYKLFADEVVESARVFDARQAWLMADMLSDNEARSREFGRDSALAFDFPVAAKTGTSTDFRDNWAIGFTPEFTVGVWVGNFGGMAMQEVSGVAGAAPVMHDVMQYLKKRFGTSWFARPDGIEERRVHSVLGDLADGNLTEWFVADAPTPERREPLNVEGRVNLPPQFKTWVDASNVRLETFAVHQNEGAPPRILSPLAGSVYFLDPDLPATSHEVDLRGRGGQLQWESATLECVERDGQAVVRLRPGRHELVMTSNGVRVTTWIRVVQQ